MSKGGIYNSTVLHSCSSGRVACETAAAEERVRWRGKEDAGFVEVEKARMEKCFPGFQHGRLFQAFSSKLVLSWGRSKVKVTTTSSKKTKRKKQQQQAGSSISFHSVPEENVSHNVDPVSPMVSCIGQVRAGGQRRRSSRRTHHRRLVSEDNNFQGRWKTCIPCTSSGSGNNSGKDFQLVLRSASASVSSSSQSLISRSGQASGGCMLAKSLLLIQQQIDNQKVSETSSSSESSPDARVQKSSVRNQSEVCLWKRRCIPQPQSLQLTRTSST